MAFSITSLAPGSWRLGDLDIAFRPSGTEGYPDLAGQAEDWPVGAITSWHSGQTQAAHASTTSLEARAR
jgi:hypothetical protein